MNAATARAMLNFGVNALRTSLAQRMLKSSVTTPRRRWSAFEQEGSGCGMS